jgi:hypothetical protein
LYFVLVEIGIFTSNRCNVGKESLLLLLLTVVPLFCFFRNEIGPWHTTIKTVTILSKLYGKVMVLLYY